MRNDSLRMRERKVNWGTLIVGLIFTTFSLYISYAIFWSHQMQTDAAASFEPVLATILDSKVLQSNQIDPTTTGPIRTYSPRIHYQYEVNGNTYQSTKFSYIGPTYSGREDVQRIVDRYLVGSRQTAYYDPGNPAEAVLHKSVTTVNLSSGYFWVPTVMIVAGLFCTFAGWRGWEQRGIVRFRRR